MLLATTMTIHRNTPCIPIRPLTRRRRPRISTGHHCPPSRISLESRTAKRRRSLWPKAVSPIRPCCPLFLIFVPQVTYTNSTLSRFSTPTGGAFTTGRAPNTASSPDCRLRRRSPAAPAHVRLHVPSLCTTDPAHEGRNEQRRRSEPFYHLLPLLLLRSSPCIHSGVDHAPRRCLTSASSSAFDDPEARPESPDGLHNFSSRGAWLHTVSDLHLTRLLLARHDVPHERDVPSKATAIQLPAHNDGRSHGASRVPPDR